MAYVRQIVLISALCFAFAAMATASDFKVSDINLRSVAWGAQKAEINLANKSEDYKFVVATADILFLDTIFESQEHFKNSFIIEPLSITDLKLNYKISGNFGPGVVTVRLYDVVDTLDQPLESQEFYAREFEFEIPIPKPLKAIVDSGLYVPWFAVQTGGFDNHFSAVLALLLHRGKSLNEIAEMCETESYFVSSVASLLKRMGYLRIVDSNFVPNFAVLKNKSVDILRPQIDTTVDCLYEIIAGNLDAYDSTLTALAADGALTSDPNDLLDGGSVLYHKYPVILGPFLWNTLGKDFVTDGMGFSTPENTSWRDNRMIDFMHMVIGEADKAGHSFYYFMQEPHGERFYCGFAKPSFRWDANYRRRTRFPFHLPFGEDRPPLTFSYDEDKLRVPFSVLMQGTSKHLVELKNLVDSTFPAKSDERFIGGARYWCWNLVVDGLMERFENSGIFQREGAGIYIFQRVDHRE